MTPVLMEFLTSTGQPLGMANVEIRLSRSDFDEEVSGIIMPRLINAVTGLDGKLLIDLMPCDSRYHVTVYDTVSDTALHYHFYVPHLNTPGTIVRLQDLIVADDAVIDPVSYDVTAMLTILDAKANVLAAISRGELARDRAEAAAQFADDSIEATTDARNAAQTAALQVQVDAAQVAIDKQNVHDNALLVEDRAAVALQSKVDVLAAAAASLASATAASNSAAAAATSVYEAGQSEATAIAARDMASSSAATAVSARDSTLNARDGAYAARDGVYAARDVALVARDTAVTKADQLASQLHAFNEIYLGKFAVAPMLDGNGNTLKVGAIYENTIEGKIYQWESDLSWHAYDEESQLQLNNATLAASNAAASAASTLALKNAAADSATAAANSAIVVAGLVTAAEDSASASLASQNMAAQSVVDANEAKLTAIDAKDTATAKAAEVASYATQVINGVLSTVLGGLSTASSTVVSATDTIIAAFGKLQAQLSLKAPLESPTFTGTVKGVTKEMVGLDNVDNTADTAKPVSTAQQTVLNAKANTASPALTGTPTAPTAPTGTATDQLSTTMFVKNATDGKVDKTILAGNNDLNSITETGFYRVENSNANLVHPYSQVIVSRGADTVAQMSTHYYTGTMAVRGAYVISGVANWTPWRTLLADHNFNSYAPTLTGVGASGSWDINVKGYASGTAVVDNGSGAGIIYPNSFAHSARYTFVTGASAGNPGSYYSGVMTFTPFDGETASTGGNSYQLAFGSNANYGTTPDLKIRNGVDTTWNNWYTLWLSGNLVPSAGGEPGTVVKLDNVGGLTAFRLNLKNATGTILSSLVSGATASRTWTFPDKNGTVAMASDIPAAYALPVATTTALGGVKPDGTTITIDGAGKLSANAQGVTPNSGQSISTQITYANGNISKIIEVIGGISYTTTANYNADGSIASVVITDGTKVRTETYSYSSGILTGFTATEA